MLKIQLHADKSIVGFPVSYRFLKDFISHLFLSGIEIKHRRSEMQAILFPHFIPQYFDNLMIKKKNFMDNEDFFLVSFYSNYIKFQ